VGDGDVGISSNMRGQTLWRTYRDWCGSTLRYVADNALSTPSFEFWYMGGIESAENPHRATQMFWGRSQPNLSSGRGTAEAWDIWDEYNSIMPSRGGSSSPSSSGSMLDDGHMGLTEGGSTSRTSSSSSASGKKTARTEAERRLALESDEWTLRVTPHEVVCRGCRRTIKLDRRSRYYPGLWEKHRDRCEHVSKMGEEMEAEERLTQMQPLTLYDPTPFMGGASSIPGAPFARGGPDPTLLAPRKSYYRNV